MGTNVSLYLYTKPNRLLAVADTSPNAAAGTVPMIVSREHSTTTHAHAGTHVPTVPFLDPSQAATYMQYVGSVLAAARLGVHYPDTATFSKACLGVAALAEGGNFLRSIGCHLDTRMPDCALWHALAGRKSAGEAHPVGWQQRLHLVDGFSRGGDPDYLQAYAPIAARDALVSLAVPVLHKPWVVMDRDYHTKVRAYYDHVSADGLLHRVTFEFQAEPALVSARNGGLHAQPKLHRQLAVFTHLPFAEALPMCLREIPGLLAVHHAVVGPLLPRDSTATNGGALQAVCQSATRADPSAPFAMRMERKEVRALSQLSEFEPK